ncbi:MULTISPECIES: hypothetical protein [Rheinheimera]|uniref:hypothetical protein n=1 Tax=Rheinheimera TaxID=67575 RepID=UPI00104344BC|nr:hypothetical protein [Rheinheimera sp. D18]QBL08552.1 hypothetical protein E0Z06_02980 [Rheinheimera sp. D18]
MISMRTLLSYVLLFALTLSGLTGTAQLAHAHNSVNTVLEQQPHTISVASAGHCHNDPVVVTADTDHSCCNQDQHQCKGDCCAKHCASSGALLGTELFCYLRPTNVITQYSPSLPLMLFADDPPPPINV